MKDQLKKTLGDTSRHAPTKNEEVIKAEDIFLTEDFSQMSIEEFNTQQECNLFRSTNTQQKYDQEMDTYSGRGNYRIYSRRNNISRHYQQQLNMRSNKK